MLLGLKNFTVLNLGKLKGANFKKLVFRRLKNVKNSVNFHPICPFLGIKTLKNV